MKTAHPAYVLGFRFNATRSQIVLLQRGRQSVHYGKFNAPGGHVEPGETPLEAVVREFHEETGLPTEPEEWTRFKTFSNWNYTLDCFCSFGPIDGVQTTTHEKVIIASVPLDKYMTTVPDLRGLVALALSAVSLGDD